MFSHLEKPNSFRFSIKDVPAYERHGAICALRERGVLPLEPLGDRLVDFQITKRFLPGVSILSGTLCGLRQDSGTQSTNDDLFFGFNLRGRSTVFQRQGEVSLGSGEAVLLSHSQGRFSIVRSTPVRFVGLRVSRKKLAPLVSRIDEQTMRPVRRDIGALKLLDGYLRALFEGRTLHSPELAQVAASHLIDLIAISLTPTQSQAVPAHARSVQAARLEVIKSDICDRLTDCSLTVAGIASRYGVTPRYVHKLFENDGITYTQFVISRRLNRAHRMLCDPRFKARSIASIAYDAGFGDISYFNRTFRRQYGATPSDIRNAGCS